MSLWLLGMGEDWKDECDWDEDDDDDDVHTYLSHVMKLFLLPFSEVLEVRCACTLSPSHGQKSG